MLWLFKARCNRGHKQCVVVETNKTKVSQSQQCKWELRTAAWQVHVFLPGQKVWNTTFPAKTSVPGTTVWCGYGLPATGEHQETLHGRVVCTRGDWGTENLSLAFMGAFRPLSLASRALGLGDQTKTTYDFYFALHPPLMWRCPPSPFLTPPVCRWDFIPLGRTQPKVYFPAMFTLWPSDLFTALCILHLIPVINFLMDFLPTVILTLVPLKDWIIFLRLLRFVAELQEEVPAWDPSMERLSITFFSLT